MTEVVTFLNENSGAISLVFAFVVTCATVFYAILTYTLVGETRRMREVQTEPALAVSVVPSEIDPNFLNLVIENIGMGPARDIVLSAHPDFERFRGEYLSQLGLFRHGVRFLAPRQRVVVFLTSILDDVHGDLSDLSRLNFRVDAEYRMPSGRRAIESYPIHFESFEQFSTIGSPPLVSIASNLKKIQEEIGKIGKGFHRLKVIALTPGDVARERQALVDKRRKRGSQATSDPGQSGGSDADGNTSAEQ